MTQTSDTPSTDALVKVNDIAALWSHARELERKLAAAHKALTMYEKARNSSVYQPSPWPAVDDAVRAALAGTGP